MHGMPEKVPVELVVESRLLRFAGNWRGKLVLSICTVALMTLSFAPVGQFYLAWIALVPWMLVIAGCQSRKSTFLWSWLTGTLMFMANMWWLAYVTTPGMIALMLYLGLYWALAGLIMRSKNWLSLQYLQRGTGASCVLGFAIIWCATEWVRGNLFTGLPWMFLGHTQSPWLIMCQIADALGVYGISFWVAAVNALIFILVIRRGRMRSMAPIVTVAILLGLTLGYGLHRRQQTPRMLIAGPRVLVVQPNYPQSNSGEKGASQQEMIDFHVNTTAKAIQKYGPIDLVCWSETMMPAINEEYRSSLEEAHLIYQDRKTGQETPAADLANGWFRQITDFAKGAQVNVITGGLFHARLDRKTFIFQDRRNSAYLIRPSGRLDVEHYDKIHLVPFGEYIPFKDSQWFGWLHSFFLSFNPYGYDYTLTTPGNVQNPAVFRLNINGNPTLRIITPICFEDIDAALCAAAFPKSGRQARGFACESDERRVVQGERKSPALAGRVIPEHREPRADGALR